MSTTEPRTWEPLCSQCGMTIEFWEHVGWTHVVNGRQYRLRHIASPSSLPPIPDDAYPPDAKPIPTYYQTPCLRCGRPVNSSEPVDIVSNEYYCAYCVIALNIVGDD